MSPYLVYLAQVETADFGSTAKFILCGYLLLLLILGYCGYRKSTASEEDYYLAGRGQGWIVSSLTIMATFFSSFALLGAPGLVYKEGVVFALFALNVPLGGATIYVVGSRIAAAGRARGYVTPADMISEHYQSDVVLRLLVALICFLYALPYVVMQINAGGILSEVLFPDVQHAFEIGATGLALVTMVYIMVGGMRSVAWTDVVQGSFLLGGMLLAGIATVCVLGGVDGFLEKVSRLPPKSLSAPGTTGSWPPEKLFTVCIFSSLGSMIQPAQWMRYYAARSGVTLRRSALIFGTVLPICFFFGVMLVGLGGQALYPIIDSNGQVLPHPDVGATARDFDKILVVTLRDHLPELMGAAGVFLSTLILVAIMAASMSTADSNLHAMSAVVTRDVYDRFLRPHASEREKTWLGRFVIAVVTILALLLILWGRQSVHFNPVALLAQMGLLAISFSTQLVPVTVDMLFLRRGTKWGAIAGTAAGVSVVFAFTPLFSQLVSGNTALLTSLTSLRKMIDIGALGCGVNSAVFLIVSVIEHRVRGGNHAQ